MGKTNNLIASRVNFLYQCSNLLLSQTDSQKRKKKLSGHEKVANHYSKLMINISQKSVQRLSKDIKRTICKGCKSVLKPGVNAKAVLSKKNRKIGSLCQLCGEQKLFPLDLKKPQKKQK